ncbi:DUF6600 domain-containing protein [Ideonella sp. BN130291]|uniref:DUF6600 domain-containing protein n=1 Tax=Ideonella sp. BN130291 TaxID=3112940 RepID=UPI002E26D14F|nr:DUF6600 domain-containing protein [Ideonella sp. BN130291]
MLTLVLCGAAWADPPGRVGRLAQFHGTVWMYDTDQGEWVAAERNRPLTTGDRLATDRDGQAELRIGSTTVRVAADTELALVQLDDQRMRLQLERGSVAARLRSRETAAEFQLLTAEGSFTPQRPGHYRIDRDDTLSAANVWDGELRFEAPDSTLVVPRGQRAEFWKEGSVTHYTWAGMPQDSFTDWVQAEDRRDERNATARYVSPEMTGYEDLDRYGRWDRHPEYGTIWVPVQVAPSWAPYRHGRWAWVRPWGWTWVDEAPWGFAPFHYGRWFWWGGRWAWAPGSYVARPVYAPALVGWVGGPQVSVSIHIGSPPLVGWVPLAPREVYYPAYPVGPGYWRHLNPHAPDRFYRPGQPPRGPVMYTNRGVPGGVTVVPSDVLKQRQPVANVARTVDPRMAQQLASQKATVPLPPPPPAGARPAPTMPGTTTAVAPAQGHAPQPTAYVPPPPGRSGEAQGRPADGRRSHGVVVAPSRREAPASGMANAPAAAPAAAAPPGATPAPAAAAATPAPAAARPTPAQLAEPRMVPPPPSRHDVPVRRGDGPPAARAMPPPAQPQPPAAQRELARPPTPPPAAAPHAQPPRETQARDEGEGRGQRPREGGHGRPGGPRTQVE